MSIKSAEAIGWSVPLLQFASQIGEYDVDTGANRRSDDMAQLRLSTILRVGSNKMTRRFRSSLTMLVKPGKNGWLGIRAGISDQWGKVVIQF